MTKEEIDKTIKILIGAKKSGQFRAFWTTFDESVNLMAAGEVVIQSMWSPAVHPPCGAGIPCYYGTAQRRLPRVGELHRADAPSHRAQARCRLRVPQLVSVGWQGGFIAKQGYYSSVPETARKFMTEDEWGFWYDGKDAKSDIKDPYGTLMEKAGQKRDGGAFWERMGKVPAGTP